MRCPRGLRSSVSMNDRNAAGPPHQSAYGCQLPLKGKPFGKPRTLPSPSGEGGRAQRGRKRSFPESILFRGGTAFRSEVGWGRRPPGQTTRFAQGGRRNVAPAARFAPVSETELQRMPLPAAFGGAFCIWGIEKSGDLCYHILNNPWMPETTAREDRHAEGPCRTRRIPKQREQGLRP